MTPDLEDAFVQSSFQKRINFLLFNTVYIYIYIYKMFSFIRDKEYTVKIFFEVNDK